MVDLVQIIDELTGLKKAYKKPVESRLFDVDVEKYMRSGDNIFVEGTIVNTLLSGTDVSPLLLTNLAHDSIHTLQFRAADGDDGARHKVSITFTTAGGDFLEADFVIEISEDF